ncbi:adenine phosphoribosyltransferase 1 [Aspergillus heteromorphus CBS 117.55]|uniref:adenine phosphoribosyltransferase n=1 Tax=Aspergillus heteromorphus CBS 117.55 TaxID=1448321 RepID=A0A317VUV8_9EURO|nr:adenine phosphoribosyltransferase 1 [Aspergillus heteromorphus CBS 117.55]PWY77131.1 adenine phosphoribosyltransferase 1 [Aspergillus heteromorphus CBS 117.55]
MSQPTTTPPLQPPHATAAAQVGQSSTSPASAAELASLKVKLRGALRQFPDFPSPGILFEDILPIFADPTLHEALVRCLELHILASNGNQKPDVIVGLEARGFLMGPSLALRMGAGFVPVRKQGKLPGPCATKGYQKEYGEDFFQMQSDAIKPGQKVIVVDDIIATGGSAYAAGELIKDMGGDLMGFVFLLELEFLKGRDKLPAPVYTLLTGQEEKMA